MMAKSVGLTGVFAICLGTAWASGACPMGAPVLEAGGFQVQWKRLGPPIAVGEHFALEVQVCPAGSVLKRVDAVMPAHRHGMNYRVSLKPLGGDRWYAEGLLFHMPGRWELRLDVASGERTEKLTDTIDLP